MEAKLKFLVFSLLLSLSPSVFGAGPLFRHEGILQREFDNVYKDIRSAKRNKGEVLQVVVGTTQTTASTTSTSFQDSNLTATITPMSNENTILVFVSAALYAGAADEGADMTVSRNGTDLGGSTGLIRYRNAGSTENQGAFATAHVSDSPASTSAITYKARFRSVAGGSVIFGLTNTFLQTIILMEVRG